MVRPPISPQDPNRVFRRANNSPFVDPQRRNEPPILFIPQEAPPLALLPLRLEYRFVSALAPIPILDRTDLLPKLARAGQSDAARGRSLRGSAAKARRTVLKDALTFSPIRPIRLPRDELWIRWYPDENFALRGVQPASTVELAALAAFDAALGSRPWWTAGESPETAAAWLAFATLVGPARAVALKRNAAVGTDVDPAQQIGRIAGLPNQVALFAQTAGKMTQIGVGVAIPSGDDLNPSEVRYTPSALQPDGWLTNFDRAVALGMGIKIADAAALKAAKEADWLIAIGLSGAQGPAEMTALLNDAIANASFAVLPQDTPTNNTASAKSGYSKLQTDALAYLTDATQEERGLHDTPKTTAAELIAEAIAVDERVVRKAVNGADLGFEDARAMLRVIGPILLDGLLDGQTTSFVPSAGADNKPMDENTFINAIAVVMSARGVLPAVRFGNTAYGLLPLADVAALTPAKDAGFTPDQQRVFGTLSVAAQQAALWLPLVANVAVPVLRPDDPSASDKLEAILKTNPVSKRIDVFDSAADARKPRAIGCPYVQGVAAEKKADSYLEILATQPIRSLPDPTEDDPSWPLLYRLARLSLTRNITTAVFGEFGIERGKLNAPIRNHPRVTEQASLFAEITKQDLVRLSGTNITSNFNNFAAKALLQRVTAEFGEALRHLQSIAQRPGGIAQLEMLLCETIDFFQHRFDAVAVGLAYARIKANRKSGHTNLLLGYYGFLGKLRPALATGGSDGYIQAPSQPQAMAAAVMRSAYTRHRGEGAFALNLSGARIRRGLRLLDLLSKGHSLGEALGLRGERWLHEQHKDVEIYPLRQAFPIADEVGDGSSGRRVFDGQAFAIANTAVSPTLTELRRVLRDELDTIADLVTAEAVYQRAQGLAPAANAWLKVLSGGPIPGTPAFVRTQRSGHGSTHRISLLLAESAPSANATLLEILEPAVASLAETVLTKFNQARVALRVAKPVAGSSPQPLMLSLSNDLGLRPIDLVFGGARLIEHRAKTAILDAVAIDPSLLASMGASADADAFANGAATFEADLTIGPAPVDVIIAKADQLRRTCLQARPLDAGDLNAAAAGTAGLLDEADEVAALEYGIAALKGRAQAALTLCEALRAPIAARLTAYIAAVGELGRREVAAEPAANIAAQRGVAETGRRQLVSVLRPLHVMAIAEALEPISLDVDKLAGSVTEGMVKAALDRVEAKRQRLASANARPASGHATAAAARADLNEIIAALKDMVSGEGFIILAPVPRDRARTTPVLNTKTTVATALSPWAGVRQRVDDAMQLASVVPAWVARATSADATADDAGLPADQQDPEDEERSPRSYHFGQFIGEQAVLSAADPVVGLVCDEWAEQRPSNTQRAAIAVNYDSPQSEPPSAILLATPPNASMMFWDAQGAANIVGEAIRWMQIRALSTEQRLTGWTLMPGANQVPYTTGRPPKPRVPVRKLSLKFDILAVGSSPFAVMAANSAVRLGVEGAGITERISTGRIKD